MISLILLDTPFLFQALAELYVIDGQYEKAFSLYADVSVLDAYLFRLFTKHFYN